jgi:methylated-DNA-[protein]-cysteine S-methyltransferase
VPNVCRPVEKPGGFVFRVAGRMALRENECMSDSAPTYTYLSSPIGDLLIAGMGEAMHLISFSAGRTARKPGRGWVRDDTAFAEARRQLDAYFAGELMQFDLPLSADGSPFDKAVWNAMSQIPYGETVSYGEIAKCIGEPVSASRAVGIACGTNPLPVVVPCHRVIGANGSLTGFGGGLAIKEFLLDLERKVRPLPGQQLALFG